MLSAVKLDIGTVLQKTEMHFLTSKYFVATVAQLVLQEQVCEHKDNIHVHELLQIRQRGNVVKVFSSAYTSRCKKQV